VSDKALTWIVEGLVAKGLRGTIEPTLDRTSLIEVQAPVCLLFMRLVAYIHGKFQFRVEDGKCYMKDLSPPEVFRTVFASPFAMHYFFPRGKSVKSANELGFNDAPTAAPPNFMPMLLPLQQELIMFLRDFFDERDDLMDVATQEVKREQMVSAQTFLERSEVKNAGFDIVNIYSEYQLYYTPALPPPPPAPAPGPVVEDPLATHLDTQPVEDEIGPPGEVQTNVQGFFEVLQLPELYVDKFNSIDPLVFRKMLQWAERKIDDLAQFTLRPTEVPAMRDNLAHTDAHTTCGPLERGLYYYLPAHLQKAVATNTHVAQLPPVTDKDFDKVASVLLGDFKNTDLDSTELEKQSLFQAKGSHDILLASDGRRPAMTKCIQSTMKKISQKRSGFFVKTPSVSFRLSFHNREFGVGKARPRRKKTHLDRAKMLHNVPDPLETFHQLFDRKFRVDEVERMHLDTPGTNRSRGLNNVPLRPGVADSHRAELPCFVHADCVASLLPGLFSANDKEDRLLLLCVRCICQRSLVVVVLSIMMCIRCNGPLNCTMQMYSSFNFEIQYGLRKQFVRILIVGRNMTA
jgi:hypothetical protein